MTIADLLAPHPDFATIRDRAKQFLALLACGDRSDRGDDPPCGEIAAECLDGVWRCRTHSNEMRDSMQMRPLSPEMTLTETLAAAVAEMVRLEAVRGHLGDVLERRGHETAELAASHIALETELAHLVESAGPDSCADMAKRHLAEVTKLRADLASMTRERDHAAMLANHESCWRSGTTLIAERDAAVVRVAELEARLVASAPTPDPALVGRRVGDGVITVAGGTGVFRPSHPTTLGDVWVGETRPAGGDEVSRTVELIDAMLLRVRDSERYKNDGRARMALENAAHMVRSGAWKER